MYYLFFLSVIYVLSEVFEIFISTISYIYPRFNFQCLLFLFSLYFLTAFFISFFNCILLYLFLSCHYLLFMTYKTHKKVKEKNLLLKIELVNKIKVFTTIYFHCAGLQDQFPGTRTALSTSYPSNVEGRRTPSSTFHLPFFSLRW